MTLDGKIVKRSSLEQMRRAIPVISQAGERIEYGLGLLKVEIPGCGTFWGHDGTVWGAETLSLTRTDGKQQMSVAMNLVRCNKPDSSGKPQRHPIDDAPWPAALHSSPRPRAATSTWRASAATSASAKTPPPASPPKQTPPGAAEAAADQAVPDPAIVRDEAADPHLIDRQADLGRLRVVSVRAAHRRRPPPPQMPGAFSVLCA
ncbi:hypothetical protein ACIBI9_28905 [Nonomuraea sp. NPDC050451]|uniref:hypothetical protein n=1 Tax=Nonomuraea sp. NPDC050451 TaxID=3364364 RepID=UPI0037AB5CDF